MKCMKARTLPLLLPLLLLSSCKDPFQGIPSGGHTEFRSDSLPSEPYEDEIRRTIEGHEFLFQGVLSDGEGGFLLVEEEAPAYIRNKDIQFGLRFKAREGVILREWDEEEGPGETIEPMQVEDGIVYYAVFLGFEITFDPVFDKIFPPTSIGTMVHWC